MPNWVINKITISGPEDKIQEFEEKMIKKVDEDSEEKVFSFHSILPTPEELINTISPNPRPEIKEVIDENGNKVEVMVYRNTLNEFEIQNAIREGRTPPKPIPCNNATPEMCDQLLLKYGRTNWYDWQMSSWGTKWDACDPNYDYESKTLDFQTAWCCPEKIISRMAEMFPDLSFDGYFADEDIGSNAGTIDNGVVNWEEGEEALSIAKELWGITEE